MGTFPVTLFGIMLLIIGLMMLFEGYKCEDRKQKKGEFAFYCIGGILFCGVGMIMIVATLTSPSQTYDKNEGIYLKSEKELHITDKEYKDKDNNIAMREVREAVAKKLNINNDDVIIEKESDKDNRYIATTSVGIYYVQTSEGTINIDGIVKKQ